MIRVLTFLEDLLGYTNLKGCMGIDGSAEAFHPQCPVGSRCSQAVTFREYGVYLNITAA